LMPTCISLMTLISGWLGMLLLVRFVEEPFMESKHSLNYSEYASSVGRFVPGLGLIRQDTDPDGIE
jgi:protein-S-isoprenylcysteine O-methyltransferase Ste14